MARPPIRGDEDLRRQTKELAKGDGNRRTVGQYRRLLHSAGPNVDPVLDILPSQVKRETVAPRAVRQPRNTLALGTPPQALNERRYNETLRDLERAALVSSRFGVPLEWVADQHPDDVPVFADPELMEYLVPEAGISAQTLIRKRALERSVNERVTEMNEERRGWVNTLSNLGTVFPVASALTDGAAWLMENYQANTSDKVREQAMNEVLRRPDPLSSPSWFDQLWQGDQEGAIRRPGISSLFTFLGKAMNFGVGVAATQFTLVSEGASVALGNEPGTVTNFVVSHFNDRREAQLEEQREAIDLTEQQQMQTARQIFGESAYEELLAQGKLEDIRVISMGLSGGAEDPFLTRALYDQYEELIWSSSPEAQEQSLNLVDALTEQQEAMIQALDEEGMTVAGLGSDILGWYGMNVPMRLGTYFTVFLNQEDILDATTSKTFQDIHEEAVAHKFSPSASLGIDGTWQGVVTDLGLGIMFDPTTYIFGPRGRVGGATNVDDAVRIANSPIMRRSVDDLIEATLSPRRTEMSKISLAEDLDSFGLLDEFDSAVVGVETLNPRRPWLDTPEAIVTREAPNDALLAMLPEDLVAQGRARAASLSDDVLDNAVTLQYRLGKVSMSVDDVAIVLRNTERGFNATPAFGRVAADNAAAQAAAITLDPATPMPQTLVNLADNTRSGYAFQGMRLSADEAADLLAGRTRQTRGGLTRDRTGIAEMHARKHGAEGYVIVWDQAHLSPAVNDALNVSDIANLNRMTSRSGPMPQPVAVYRADDFDALVASSRQAVDSGTPTHFGGAEAPGYRDLPDNARLLPDDTDGTFALLDIFERNDLYPALADARQSVLPLIERLVKLGGGNQYPLRTLMSRTFATEFRDALEHTSIGDWTTRYFTRQNTSPFLRTRGVGWQQDVRQNIIRMFGHDQPKMDLWLRRFRQATHQDTAAVNRLIAELDDINRQIAHLADQTTGAYGPLPAAADDVIDLRAPDQPVTALAPDQAVLGEAENIIDNAMVDMADDAATAELGAVGAVDDLDAAAPDLGVAPPGGQTDEVLDEVADLEGAFFDESTMGLSPEDLAEANARIAERAHANATMMAARKRLEAQRTNLANRIARMQESHQVAASKAARTLIEDMWNDFNRSYIGKNKQWADVVDETGFVAWEHISGASRRRIPERARTAIPGGSEADVGGLVPNRVLDELIPFDPNSSPTGVSVPVPPIDMIAAAELAGAKWLRWQQVRWGEHVKDTANFMNRVWMIDKVFKISTGLRVSFDELLRIFHTYGAPAVFQWLEDKVMLTAAKVKAPRGAPGQGLGDVIDSSRAIFGNERWQKRMQTLQEYPEFYKRGETQYYEHFEDSWDDIQVGEREWLPSMDRWTNNLLENEGFRAFLRGPEGFAEFWQTEQAAKLRTTSALDFGPGHTRVATMDEFQQGFDFIMENILLRRVRPERREAVRKAFREAAQRIDEGKEVVSLAPSILRELNMPIRGIRNQAPHASLSGRISNAFFDNMFMAPTNYRRGFIADLARRTERARLTKLYNSQGMQIIPDTLIDQFLGGHGLSGNARFGVSEAIEQQLIARGYVPESTITRLAERRAMAEMENTMYTWHMTSRAGRSAANRAAFPFGRPYFDMWSYYGRELFTRPALRGYINNTNFANLGNIANKAADYLPFNPRTPAMVSRVAATSLDAEHDKTDFSPLMFLPSADRNIMQSILPGFGLLPMWAIDYAIRHVYDPVDDPEDYQRLQDAVAAWIPPAGFQPSSGVGRYFGGGSIATALKFGIDAYMVASNNTWHEPLSLLGDIQSENMTNRALKRVLANPDEFADLMQAHESELPAAFDALLSEAFAGGAGTHARELAAGFFSPFGHDFDTTQDDVQQVWLDAGAMFSELQGPRYRANVPEDEQAEQADNIRRRFFDLPDRERDLMIVKYPQLAINMIGGWEWTDKAINEFPAVAASPYRTGGTTASLALHESYVRNDYVRPVQPTVLIHRIIGTIFQARVDVAKRMYSDTAESVNNFLWENMPEDAAAFFTQAATQVDAEDGRDVWMRWGQLEEQLEEVYGPMSVPDRMRAWGESWAGLDDENFSKRFRELTITNIPESVQEAADVLGLDVEPGMTGEQLLSQIHTSLTQNVSGNALASYTRGEFDSYNNARSAAFNSARNNLSTLAASNTLFAPEFQDGVREFLDYADRTSALRGLNGTIDIDRANNTREMYKRLMNANPDMTRFSWEETWREGFESSFGPLDWTPPVPPTLDPEDHSVTYRPFVWDVVDGDTIIVSREPTASFLNLPGNRFDVGMEGTTPTLHQVRLLGVTAPELGSEEGEDWLNRLSDAILEARNENKPIYLVRDPAQAGRNTDMFGRELAWLFIGDEPYNFPETMEPGS